tara:strand:+ start:4733 stop:5323 length:591 start_codon:yes stop_codon:yes gene_type:complete
MAAPIDFSACATLEDCFAVKRFHQSLNKHESLRDTALSKYATGCKVVKELGVFQGVTFGRFLSLDGVEEVVGVDISFDIYRSSIKDIIDSYAEENKKKVTMLEMSSTDINSVSPCDFLHIDSVHNPQHLLSELALHASSVSSRIAFHDVNQNGRALFKVVAMFVGEFQPYTWEIIEDYDQGKCGFTVIERKRKLSE